LRLCRCGLLALLVLALWGCGDAASDGVLPIAVPTPQLRPSDELLRSPTLQRVVDLQVRRDGVALRGLLGDPSPAVRARAAFALGSVQDPDAEPTLRDLLDDPEAAVRRDAAFALGQLELSDGGHPFVDALEREEDSHVRRYLAQAVGKSGADEAVERLLDLDLDDEPAARTDALARAAIRGVRFEGLVSTLAENLTHSDPDVRKTAAFAFARMPDVESWADRLEAIRDALDSYSADDAAAMHLVLALARVGDVEDLERLLQWLTQSDDWRVRANAAQGLGTVSWISREGVRPSLFRALDDPSEQVAIRAARGLTQGLWVPTEVLAEMERRIQGPAEQWRTHVPFLRQLAHFHDPEPVVEWTRRMVAVHPMAVLRGLQALAEVPTSLYGDFVFELAQHRSDEVRAVAVRILAERWQAFTVEAGQADRLYEVFASAIREGSLPEAMYAARALVNPTFLERGGLEVLHEAYGRYRAEEELYPAGVLLGLLGQVGDPPSIEVLEEALAVGPSFLRRSAAQALGVEGSGATPSDGVDSFGPDRTVDWAFLASLGSSPRLHIETERGVVVLRMVPEQAPLTVQSLAQQVEAGLHDGVRFHRLEPNFVIQGGDIAMGDGTGGPSYALRSEYTQIPFGRGVVGMASAGKDTEGSQFFITHSRQLHLDGQMSAFGWVESGHDVLDRLLDGDRVVRMFVEADGDP